MKKVVAVVVFVLLLPITVISIFLSEIKRAVDNFRFTSRVKSEISEFLEILKSL